jgi:hypothetical protein
MAVRGRRSFGGKARATFGKHGPGVSVGVPGLRIGIGAFGVHRTIGLPGTGVWSHKYLGSRRNPESTTHANPTPVRQRQDNKTSRTLQQAQEALGINNDDLAQKRLNAVPDRDRGRVDFLLLNGLLKYRQQQNQEAINSFYQALSQDDGEVDEGVVATSAGQHAIRVMGVSMEEEAMWDGIIDWADYYKIGEPGTPQFLIVLATAHYMKQNYSESLRLLDQAGKYLSRTVDADPALVDGLRHFWTGLIAVDGGYFDVAISCYEKMDKILPGFRGIDQDIQRMLQKQPVMVGDKKCCPNEGSFRFRRIQDIFVAEVINCTVCEGPILSDGLNTRKCNKAGCEEVAIPNKPTPKKAQCPRCKSFVTPYRMPNGNPRCPECFPSPDPVWPE